MEPERWKRVEELFHAALEREPQAASEFLQQACRDDPELLREVQSLLDASRQSLGFAHSAIVNVAREQIASLSPIGKRVGAYVLQEKLGEGGMGAVYLGAREDGKGQRQVAIKLIQPWVRLSPRTLRRFTTEQSILVNLKHPNIAGLLDAGITDDNSPYFVMEYVDGKPIDEYCSNTRLLTNDRLRLLLTVCGAVEHAHKNRVIHRDIKPANILVTAEGVPKLLDFGIAKLLNPIVKEQTLTRLSQRMMTLEYASPEQVYGGKITTATDVYALGVLLYELLTGHHPFRLKGRSLAEIMKIICEQRAEVPSQAIDPAADRSPGDAANRLPGDLDHIVLMAMHKQPSHRYQSVDALSRDVAAYLSEYPLLTRTYSPARRIEKIVRRHKRAIVAALLMILALLALAIGIATSNRKLSVSHTNKLFCGQYQINFLDNQTGLPCMIVNSTVDFSRVSARGLQMRRFPWTTETDSKKQVIEEGQKTYAFGLFVTKIRHLYRDLHYLAPGLLTAKRSIALGREVLIYSPWFAVILEYLSAIGTVPEGESDRSG